MSPSHHLLVLPPRLNTCLWTKHMTSAVTSLACQVDIAWVFCICTGRREEVSQTSQSPCCVSSPYTCRLLTLLS
ncbi:hypothetical protein DAEQUDRAFT_559868 [Daedalea quercina L-15889]|uniref:Uncharacterized protein n=1 Tax=Daedalea quercina L-15889 TaxID=1314783 RepID=A0A165M0N9_9APHY|nr:hypothetical protein DAEQUDRAFT_559868 [Daedalea quercina L-15889]